MIPTPEITFRGLPQSDALEADVRKKIEKLDRFFQHIMRCRVVLEAAHKHHHKGNLYHVRITLNVPGRELVVSRDPKKRQAHEDPYVAVRDAFLCTASTTAVMMVLSCTNCYRPSSITCVNRRATHTHRS